MAKDKLEYLESKYSPEEAQSCRDNGDKYLFGNYVTPEEHDAFWKSQEPPTALEHFAPLILLGVVGLVFAVGTGVVKGVKWLMNWRNDK